MKDRAGKLRSGFKCECKETHHFAAYVFAHWHDEIVHTCSCGRRHLVVAGEVDLLDRRATKAEVDKLYGESK